MNTLLFAAMLLTSSAGLTSEVMEVSGSVTVERSNKQVEARVGMVLESGDKLVTAKDSHIAFMMPGNALVSLGSDTSLVIDESKESKEGFSSTVNLLKGRLRSLVGGIFGRKVAFNTKTPNAVAGVRGTYIMADVGDNGVANFYTINGQQEIKHNNGNSMMLGSGQGIAVLPTGFGEALNINNDIIGNMQADTTIPITLPTNVLTATVNSQLANPANSSNANAALSESFASSNSTTNTGIGDFLPPATQDATLDIHIVIQ